MYLAASERRRRRSPGSFECIHRRPVQCEVTALYRRQMSFRERRSEISRKPEIRPDGSAKAFGIETRYSDRFITRFLDDFLTTFSIALYIVCSP
jgi:hypothetical protein